MALSFWMQMIKSRNLSCHTYNEDTANKIISAIIKDYHPQFLEFNTYMTNLNNKEED